MKAIIAFFGILGLALAGCSPAQPPRSSIENEASADFPAWCEVKVVERKLNPINSIAGTTLPAGSWQIDVKLRVRAREALFLPMADHEMYAKLAAGIGLGEKPSNAFELWGWSQGTPPQTPIGQLRARPSMHEFVYEAARAGAEKDIWQKILAEPLGNSEWKFSKMQIEPAFGGARPRDHFRPCLVFGAPEQVREQSVVQAAYDHEAEQCNLIHKLMPHVEALRTESENNLSEKYYRDADAKIQPIVQKRMALMHEHDARVSQIITHGDDAHDNYATRDRLIKAESARVNPLFDALDAEYRSLEAERNSSPDRAKADIEKQIEELVVSQGIDHAS